MATSPGAAHNRALSSKVGDAVAVNFKKSGEDPVIKPAAEYPSWLWELDLPTVGELKA
jgi:hypothetical protein